MFNKYLFLFFAFTAIFFNSCAHHRREIFSSRQQFTGVTATVAVAPVNAPAIWPSSAPTIYARYAILIDARSGKTLYQKLADVRTPVASTQKLITALLAIKKGSLDDFITIRYEDASVNPSKLNLRVGDRYSRRALLNAALVASMNDAASALGRDAAGDADLVGPAMTHFAQSVGAYNSMFLNASGLPASQYSTARDMARIAWHAYYNSVIRQIVAQPTYLFQYANKRTRLLENTNLLIYKSTIYNGLKTGDTKASGRCLITSATWHGRAFILVQIGSKTRYIFNDAERMMAWAFKAF